MLDKMHPLLLLSSACSALVPSAGLLACSFCWTASRALSSASVIRAALNFSTSATRTAARLSVSAIRRRASSCSLVATVAKRLSAALFASVISALSCRCSPPACSVASARATSAVAFATATCRRASSCHKARTLQVSALGSHHRYPRTLRSQNTAQAGPTYRLVRRHLPGLGDCLRRTHAYGAGLRQPAGMLHGLAHRMQPLPATPAAVSQRRSRRCPSEPLPGPPPPGRRRCAVTMLAALKQAALALGFDLSGERVKGAPAA